jgi:cell division protein FtsZ
MAVTSPLLDDISVEGATGVLINIVGGPDLKMKEIQEAASLVQEQAHEDANIIFGASIDETLGENVKVTVIATGFDAAERAEAMEMPAQRPTMAPQTVPSAAQQPSRVFQHGVPSMRPAIDSAAVMSPRRTMHAHEMRTQASHASQAPAASQQRPTLRERPAQDPFPNLDHDWDVPAFQRKQR